MFTDNPEYRHSVMEGMVNSFFKERLKEKLMTEAEKVVDEVIANLSDDIEQSVVLYKGSDMYEDFMNVIVTDKRKGKENVYGK